MMKRSRPQGTWERTKDKDVERSGELWKDIKKLAKD